MKRFFLPAMLILSGARVVAHADLGDTPAQVEARYGAPQGQKKEDAPGVTTKYYSRGDFGVVVRFLNGKSQAENYIKGRKEEFNTEEIAVLLKANAMGSDWQSVYKSAGTQRWELKSREATAVYSHSDHTFVVSTKEYIRAAARLKIIYSD